MTIRIFYVNTAKEGDMAFNYKDPRWQKRRLEIMERDGFQCIACGDQKSELHVHHKRYRGQPWEAKDGDMQTLCTQCHKALGPHPKAGIWYERYSWCTPPYLIINHCPKCGGNSWFANGYTKTICCSKKDCDYYVPYLPRCHGYSFGDITIDPALVYEPELLVEIRKEVQHA
jgi:hypothetical protein